MSKQDILNRNDIQYLITEFYDRVRKNKEIGFFFNDMIKDWPEHIEKLTDFWETNLLFVGKYKGNPIEIHQKVDTSSNHKIAQHHFGIWLNIWFDTIDTHFQGELADTAKRRAQKMSTFMFLKIYEHRHS